MKEKRIDEAYLELREMFFEEVKKKTDRKRAKECLVDFFDVCEVEETQQEMDEEEAKDMEKFYGRCRELMKEVEGLSEIDEKEEQQWREQRLKELDMEEERMREQEEKKKQEENKELGENNEIHEENKEEQEKK